MILNFNEALNAAYYVQLLTKVPYIFMIGRVCEVSVEIRRLS